MKNLEVNQLVPALKSTFSKLRRYSTFIFIMSILLIYGFLIVRISVLSQAEPTESAIQEQTNTLKRLKIDQSSIEKIEQLEDQNVGVQSLFETARDNPFQD